MLTGLSLVFPARGRLGWGLEGTWEGPSLCEEGGEEFGSTWNNCKRKGGERTRKVLYRRKVIDAFELYRIFGVRLEVNQGDE